MFIPKTIDLEQSKKYILSIRIKANEFMFSISEPNVGKNYWLWETNLPLDVSLTENVKRIVFENDFLTQEFLNTNVVIVSPEYDLVPLEYFDEKKKNSLFDFIHLEKDKHIISRVNEKQEVATIFDIDQELYEFLARSLYNPTFYHHTNLLIEFFAEKNKIKSLTSKIFINFQDDTMDVIAFRQSEFAHCLSYKGESVNNQIYYILNMWEKCGFNQHADQLLMFGKSDPTLLPRLQEYIRHINSIHTPSEIYLWSEDALKAPLDLLTLSL